MKITVVVIDDDTDSRFIISDYINKNCPDIVVAGEAGSVKDGLLLIRETKPDLLLLDIEMPDGTGFDMLEKLPEQNFEVVFITAYNAYAIKAFRLAAIDYLLKPVSNIELDEAIKKAGSRMEEKYFTRHWTTLLHNAEQQNRHDKKIAIATAEGFMFVLLRDIIRLESNSNYTHFYFINGKKLISSRTLGYYEDILPEDKFCRIHHSSLVNIDYVEKYVKGGAGGTIVMQDGIELDVSQRKKENVLKLLTKGYL